ncbi:MAG: OmpH family outer membrane protein [Neisseria sp.]|nr:OmpH family outer membrane protein [Neisseria sp.]
MNQKTLWTKWTAAALLSSVLATPAVADGIQKLGFVKTERVFQETKQAQAIGQTLAREFAERQKKLDAMQAEGLALQNKVAAQKAGKERDKNIAKLNEMSRQFRLEEARLAEEYNLRRNEEFAALQHNANRVIFELAKKQGYDLILQDAVYIQPKFDITDQVIQEMDR